MFHIVPYFFSYSSKIQRWSEKYVQLNNEFLNFYKSEESDHHDFCMTSKELFKANIESKKGAIAIYNTVKNERFLLVNSTIGCPHFAKSYKFGPY